MADNIRFPNHSQRTSIIGRTGSGKTVAGLWHLSNENFSAFPWVILNTKGDKLIGDIGDMDAVKHITLDDTPGRKGLYIVSPAPNQHDAMNDFLMRIWSKEKCGLYVDEGYMIDHRKVPAINLLLTQGRSKKIPMIFLSQRPAYVSRFVFSESDFFQIFHLNSDTDKKSVEDFLPRGATKERLAEYHSLWYDVGKDRLSRFSPVPQTDTILKKFSGQLQRQFQRI